MQATPGETVTWDSDFTDLRGGCLRQISLRRDVLREREGGSGCDPIFVRTARPPSWIQDGRASFPFPVVVVTNVAVERRIAERIRPDVFAGRRFSVFDVGIGDTPYAQVVARITYQDALSFAAQRRVWIHGRSHLGPLALLSRCRGPGLARWVRRAAISASALFDGSGHVPSSAARSRTDGGPRRRRALPLFFFRPAAGGGRSAEGSGARHAHRRGLRRAGSGVADRRTARPSPTLTPRLGRRHWR